MSLWCIAWRYLWCRPLVTALTLTSVALGCALIASVLTLRRETERAFIAESGIFDMVVGAKGSPLQLVLSSLYHLDIPTGNIPYTRYEALSRDPRVRRAVPIGLGDNYRGYRIIGTESKMFEVTRTENSKSEETPLFSLQSGRFFTDDFEVILGASVARQTQLKVGDSFVGSHGLVVVAGSEEHKEFPYKVVGILSSSGTSSDRAIFTSLNSVWKIHDREAQLHGKTAHESQVTSVLIQLKAAGMRLMMSEEIKNKTESMAAIPISEVLRLYQRVLVPVQQALLGTAGLVVVVALLTILTTLYQAAERRRREIALMRTIGAHPVEILVLILLESTTLTLFGILTGWVLGHGGVTLAGFFLQEHTGLAISGWSCDRMEMAILAAVGVSGTLAGLGPAWFGYRRSPARELTSAG